MKAQRRIEKICQAVKLATKYANTNPKIADIGTDHGYIAEKILKMKLSDNIIATDISQKCLDKLKSRIERNGISGIETRIGNGLEAIDNTDICVIAGMGGFEISKMLKYQNGNKNGRKCNLFVLQPTQNAVELRDFIISNHWKIIKDETIEDSERYYPIIVVDVSKKRFYIKSIKNLWIGRNCDENNYDYKKYLEYLDEYLAFTDKISWKRAREDKILYQKKKLAKIVKNEICKLHKNKIY